MSVYLDRKYLLLVSSRLDRFSQKKEDLFNFRCPMCGDSGYIHRKSNDYYFICHNCNYGTTFAKFLKFIDETVYRQYAIERYADGENYHSNYKKVEFNLVGPKPKECLNKLSIKNLPLPNINSLPQNNSGRQYIENRKIPKKFWNEIFYTENFKEFMDECYPEHGKILEEDSRIVLCYTNKKGEITNIAARAIGSSKKRYITVKVSEEKKVFGIHRIDESKTVFVVEGQFDSFFLDNSIASGDSNLVGLVKDLELTNFVIVFDNEPRNKELNKEIQKAVNAGYSVCLFPSNISEKDINEMVLNGIDVEAIINENTFKGLTANLKYNAWKKC
jgi:hypothetical protein